MLLFIIDFSWTQLAKEQLHLNPIWTFKIQFSCLSQISIRLNKTKSNYISIFFGYLISNILVYYKFWLDSTRENPTIVFIQKFCLDVFNPIFLFDMNFDWIQQDRKPNLLLQLSIYPLWLSPLILFLFLV